MRKGILASSALVACEGPGRSPQPWRLADVRLPSRSARAPGFVRASHCHAGSERPPYDLVGQRLERRPSGVGGDRRLPGCASSCRLTIFPRNRQEARETLSNLLTTSTQVASCRQAGGCDALVSLPALPTPRPRRLAGGCATVDVVVQAEVVTPILGGGAFSREARGDGAVPVDDVDVVRATALRGMLRFWWRALHAHRYASPSDLWKAECGVWGGVGARHAVRSPVEVRAAIDKRGRSDDTPVSLSMDGAYALFPARKPPTARRLPPTRFTLTVTCPPSREQEVRDSVRAWLLFGGYGSRTRRGLGSLTVVQDRGAWLPKAATRAAIQDLFGRDILAPTEERATDTPRLAGADVYVRAEGTPNAVEAWTTALNWLRDFRQGTMGESGKRAREPAPPSDPRRPSRSNWPEADKVRLLSRRTRGHEPRHNAVPAWPRATFGLPIVGQFQTKDRDGHPLEEPPPFELVWRDESEGEEAVHERLASPLILKALPLANGRFVPMALWLERALPGGEVVLRVDRALVAGSAAPFDRSEAAGDHARFAPLAGNQGMRRAFLSWLTETERAVSLP